MAFLCRVFEEGYYKILYQGFWVIVIVIPSCHQAQKDSNILTVLGQGLSGSPCSFMLVERGWSDSVTVQAAPFWGLLRLLKICSMEIKRELH